MMSADDGGYSDDSEGFDRHPSNPGPATLAHNGQRLRSPTPPSSQTDGSADQVSLTPRRRSHRKSRDRHSSAKDILKLLLSEESESKQSHRMLRTALSRLDAETQRAQEAERRALELAANFKLVNESRLAAEQKLNQVHEELRLYKVQYDNAQREISRGHDILKDLEAQRDDAEAVAARARTETRRLREEKIMWRAREEGRNMGYKEGYARGLEQARYEALRDGSDGSVRDLSHSASRAPPLDDMPVTNLPSPTGNDVPLVSPTPKHPIQPLGQSPEPVSRFHEHGIGMTPSPANAGLPNRDANEWPQESNSVKYVPAPSVSDTHSERQRPSDGWIPSRDPDDIIHLPPAHRLSDIGSLTPRSASQPLASGHDRPPRTQPVRPPSEPPVPKGYAASMESGTSGQSTALSQYEIVSQPTGPERLSVIRETSMEYGPDESFSMPDAVVFPSGPAEPSRGSQWGSQGPETDRSRTPTAPSSKQQLADVLRYDDPSVAESWRRQGAESVRSASTSSSRMPRRDRPAKLTTPAPLAPSSPPSIQIVPPPGAHQQYPPPRSYPAAEPIRQPTEAHTVPPPGTNPFIPPPRAYPAQAQAPQPPPETQTPASSMWVPPPRRSSGPPVPEDPVSRGFSWDPTSEQGRAMLGVPGRDSRFATPSRHSSRSKKSRSHREPSTESSDQDIRIEVEPPSGPPSSTVRTPTTQAAGMLSPVAPPPPLPPMPSRPKTPGTSTVPTEPNSPSMGRYPSMGQFSNLPGLMPGDLPTGGRPPSAQALPVRPPSSTQSFGPGPRSGPSPAPQVVSTLPAGFVVTGVTPSSTPNALPPMQSTPRSTPANLYGPSSGASTSRFAPALRRHSSLSTESTESSEPAVIPPPMTTHSRSHSESVRSGTPKFNPYAPSSASGGSRPPSYPAAPSGQRSMSMQSAPVLVPPPRVLPTQSTPGSRPASTAPVYIPGTMAPLPIAESSAPLPIPPPAGIQRSLSLNAGNTPGLHARPLSGSGSAGAGVLGPSLRRKPSDDSDSSSDSRTGSRASSRPQSSYQRYEPSQNLDAAWLARGESDPSLNDLSPNTAANTRANAAMRGAAPVIPRAASSASRLSYGSGTR